MAKMYTLGHSFVPPGIHVADSATTATRRSSRCWCREIVEAVALPQIAVSMPQCACGLREEAIVPAQEWRTR